jgi:hypothetical protein
MPFAEHIEGKFVFNGSGIQIAVRKRSAIYKGPDNAMLCRMFGWRFLPSRSTFC